MKAAATGTEPGPRGGVYRRNRCTIPVAVVYLHVCMCAH